MEDIANLMDEVLLAGLYSSGHPGISKVNSELFNQIIDNKKGIINIELSEIVYEITLTISVLQSFLKNKNLIVLVFYEAEVKNKFYELFNKISKFCNDINILKDKNLEDNINGILIFDMISFKTFSNSKAPNYMIFENNINNDLIEKYDSVNKLIIYKDFKIIEKQITVSDKTESIESLEDIDKTEPVESVEDIDKTEPVENNTLEFDYKNDFCFESSKVSDVMETVEKNDKTNNLDLEIEKHLETINISQSKNDNLSTPLNKLSRTSNNNSEIKDINKSTPLNKLSRTSNNNSEIKDINKSTPLNKLSRTSNNNSEIKDINKSTPLNKLSRSSNNNLNKLLINNIYNKKVSLTNLKARPDEKKNSDKASKIKPKIKNSKKILQDQLLRNLQR